MKNVVDFTFQTKLQSGIPPIKSSLFKSLTKDVELRFIFANTKNSTRKRIKRWHVQDV